MPRSLYEKVRAGVLEVDTYFRQRSDAAVVMGASTDQKSTLRAIEQQYASLGFPGCIECVDVASWMWDRFPVG
jgi:hypothetical protein